MEGARRIDEWSRIADKVPHLGVVPMLAPVEDDRASVLDLLPHEEGEISREVARDLAERLLPPPERAVGRGGHHMPPCEVA